MLDLAAAARAVRMMDGELLEAQLAWQESLNLAGHALQDLPRLGANALQQRLDSCCDRPARPTAELDLYPDIIVPFRTRRDGYPGIRYWAKKILEERITFAASGCDMIAAPPLTAPLALIQIGTFEHNHTGSSCSGRSTTVEVRLLEELISGVVHCSPEAQLAVAARRFQQELRTIASTMIGHNSKEPPTYFFLGGSLTSTLATSVHPAYRDRSVPALRELFWASQEMRAPFITFDQHPKTDDLVRLVRVVQDLPCLSAVDDALVLDQYMTWGDRSQVFVCSTEEQAAEEIPGKLCFAYFKASNNRPPARVEFPRWVYDSGLHHEMFDILRAECAYGVGRPYVLDIATSLAALDSEDRQRLQQLVAAYARTPTSLSGLPASMR